MFDLFGTDQSQGHHVKEKRKFLLQLKPINEWQLCSI